MHGRPRRGIYLLIMVHFHNLDIAKVSTGLLGKFHHQNRPQREVWNYQRPQPFSRGKPGQNMNLVLRQARSSDDWTNTKIQGFSTVMSSRLSDGKVQEDIHAQASRQLFQRIADKYTSIGAIDNFPDVPSHTGGVRPVESAHQLQIRVV